MSTLEESIHSQQLQLSLLENAYDSLFESLLKANEAIENPRNWKYAVLHLVHAAELLLKQRLFMEHPLFIYDNVDTPRETVSLPRALQRLKSISVELSSSEDAAIRRAVKWRNEITHYQVDLKIMQVRAGYLDLYLFVDSFHLEHFKSELLNHIPDEMHAFSAELLAEGRREFVRYGDRDVHKGYLPKLLYAQRYPVIELSGRNFSRFRYGDEPWWQEEGMRGLVPLEFCRDCATALGDLHGPACCVEVCPSCNDQLTYCGCAFEESGFWGLFPDLSDELIAELEEETPAPEGPEASEGEVGDVQAAATTAVALPED